MNMTFFEHELRKIVNGCENIHQPKFVGRDCIARLTDQLTIKLSFKSMKIADQYDALQIKLMNRSNGDIDTEIVRFEDLWGKVLMRSQSDQIHPHMWDDRGRVHWYGFTPNDLHYETLSGAVDDYLECFTDVQQSEDMDFSM